MPKNKESVNINKFGNKEVLEKFKKEFLIKGNEHDKTLLRKIQEFTKNIPSDEPKIRNTKFYSQKTFIEITENDELIDYFRKFSKKHGYKKNNYKKNKELFEELKNEKLDKIKRHIEKLKKAGLTGNQATIIAIKDTQYLNLEELLFLNKTGYVLRDELDEHEKNMLSSREWHMYREEEIEKEIQKRKMEIMISALFNDKFTLDEKQLREDIKNVSIYGNNDISTMYWDLQEESIENIEFDEPDNFQNRRSFERLKDNKNYYTKKR